MNYLEYSNIPSAILNVHKEHITDNEVDATCTILLQFLHLHCNIFVVFTFLIDFFIYFNFNITLTVEYNIPTNIATANIIWLGISFLVANINPLKNISFKNKLAYIIE